MISIYRLEDELWNLGWTISCVDRQSGARFVIMGIDVGNVWVTYSILILVANEAASCNEPTEMVWFKILGPVKTHPAARHVNKINSFGRGSHRDYKWGLPNFQSLTVTRVSFGVMEYLIGMNKMVWYCWCLGQIMDMIHIHSDIWYDHIVYIVNHLCFCSAIFFVLDTSGRQQP